MVCHMTARILSVVALALLLAACGQHNVAPAFVSTDISAVSWGRDFHLTDDHGHPRSLADFRGKAVMLYFGYTHCPDLCPTTLGNMARVRARLGPDASRVQGLFVTVDSKRDTPQVLAQYVSAFDPSFIGLYGDPRATAVAASEFKIFFAAQQPDASGDYAVDHGGGIYVFDPSGRLRLLMRPGSTIDAMANDIALLLKGA